MSRDVSAPVAVTIWEDTGLVAMARLLGQDGAAVTQSSIASITCRVTDALTEELVATVDAEVDELVYNSLQTSDPRWSEDTVGFNFLHVAPASAFPEPGKTYRLGYLFTPAAGEPFALAFDVQTKRLFGS